MTRVAAFTIVELIVAMAISAVVISIGFYGVYLLQLQKGQIDKRNQIWEEERQVFRLMTRDIRTHTYAYRQNNRFSFFRETGDTITYYWTPDFLVRAYQGLGQFEVADTFAMAVQSLQCYLNNEELEFGYCDKLRLNIQSKGQSIEWRLEKKYDVENWQKIEQDANGF